MFRLFRKPKVLIANNVYNMLVEHARHPIFYAEFKVADNLDGRFDMIVLHMILVLRRYKEHKDLDMVNHIQNAFFKDMDRNLREMGVGDVTVPKKIKKMAEAYLGRSNAYTLPFDEKNKKKVLSKLKEIEKKYSEQIPWVEALPLLEEWYRLLEEGQVGLAAYAPYLEFKRSMDQLNQARINERIKFRSTIRITYPDTRTVWTQPGPVDIKWETTVGDEKRNNIHVGGGKTKEEFVKFRTERDAQLSVPKLIIPSLQVNMRAGEVPVDDDGNPVLKVPLNSLTSS